MVKLHRQWNLRPRLPSAIIQISLFLEKLVLAWMAQSLFINNIWERFRRWFSVWSHKHRPPLPPICSSQTERLPLVFHHKSILCQTDLQWCVSGLRPQACYITRSDINVGLFSCCFQVMGLARIASKAQHQRLCLNKSAAWWTRWTIRPVWCFNYVVEACLAQSSSPSPQPECLLCFLQRTAVMVPLEIPWSNLVFSLLMLFRWVWLSQQSVWVIDLRGPECSGGGGVHVEC